MRIEPLADRRHRIGAGAGLHRTKSCLGHPRFASLHAGSAGFVCQLRLAGDLRRCGQRREGQHHGLGAVRGCSGFPGRLECFRSWTRKIKVESENTIYDIHLLIQELIGFDNDHFWGFRVGSSQRKTDRVFQDHEISMHEHNESIETALCKIYPLDRKYLFYMFDYGDSWTFKIKKVGRTKWAKNSIERCNIISSIGENPRQYPSEFDY